MEKAGAYNQDKIQEENPSDVNKLQAQSPGSPASDSGHLCIICLTTPYNAVFDCGHSGICIDCALKLFKKKKVCHLCRKTINKVMMLEPDFYRRNEIQIISQFQLHSAN
eukprot:TRINITY_DN2682_c0_g4_i2.p2 TRINITY_DN2682_c0_g4~~TRINITY_DN2682_c0_g4_i2.p2  ORF type:complete len:109 (+),score=9.83 TRINITY_DN2682_c0_g4_i2:982-1308(+)